MRAAIARSIERLAAAGVPSPHVDAIALAAHALGTAQLILAVPPPMPDDFEAALEPLVGRREAREPLQHILGYAAFRYLSLRVRPGVFLPRPETELLAQQAVDEAKRLLTAGREALVVDLCTGSGAIALSVATEAPGSRVIAVDVDPAAVALTEVNAALLDLATSSLRIEIGDLADPHLLADLDARVDVLISNPPYIPDDAVPLEREVAEHDPPRALFGGGRDGLRLPALVVEAATRLIRPGGLLVMEHADVQGAGVRELVDRTGAFEPAATHLDLTGRDRFVLTRRRHLKSRNS